MKHRDHVAQITRDAAAALRPRKGRTREARKPAPPVSPTAERVAQAGGGYSISQDGKMHVVQATLERMHARGQLNPDPDINRLLYEAGKRFRDDWVWSGLSGGSAGGVDPGRGRGGNADPAWSMPVSHFAAEARSDWRAARAAMDPDEIVVVGCVVLDEISIIEAGQVVTRNMASSRRCRELAIGLLRDGLRSLARHYGMIDKRG